MIPSQRMLRSTPRRSRNAYGDDIFIMAQPLEWFSRTLPRFPSRPQKRHIKSAEIEIDCLNSERSRLRNILALARRYKPKCDFCFGCAGNISIENEGEKRGEILEKSGESSNSSEIVRNSKKSRTIRRDLYIAQIT
jgi:hypothetical protein